MYINESGKVKPKKEIDATMLVKTIVDMLTVKKEIAEEQRTYYEGQVKACEDILKLIEEYKFGDKETKDEMWGE